MAETPGRSRGAAFQEMVRRLHERHLLEVPGVRELWLIRHADAYWGLETLEDGPIDPPLSERGRGQAARLAARLRPVRLHAIWSSDLRRARETAAAVAAGRGLEVRVDPRLREVRTDWDEGREPRAVPPGTYPFPEPAEAVVARMRSAMEEIVEGLAGIPDDPARAAVVTHNAAIAIYVSSLLGLSWGQLPVLPYFTSVTVVAVAEGRFVVRSIADATHLSAADS
ncbi:MAG TPA: histidine phosphatase family protein [Candidatus Dormibacteraeota bacterium]|nr:histidine phosphatase family protein [Candidatus Dormibacteraeota bacterium]